LPSSTSNTIDDDLFKIISDFSRFFKNIVICRYTGCVKREVSYRRRFRWPLLSMSSPNLSLRRPFHHNLNRLVNRPD
jgi:hypothetical protein